MSPESPVASHCGLFSFCGLFKSILVKTSRPSVLLPILRLVEQASPAFPPLQSAAGGLLNVIELIEVWNRSSLTPKHRVLTVRPHGRVRKRHGTKATLSSWKRLFPRSAQCCRVP